MGIQDRRCAFAGELDEEFGRNSFCRFSFGDHLWRDIPFRIVPAVGVGGGGSKPGYRSRVVLSKFVHRRFDREEERIEPIQVNDGGGLGRCGGVLFPGLEISESVEGWVSSRSEFSAFSS
jgi:hypothetical protein